MDNFLQRAYKLKEYPPFDKDIPDDIIIEQAWVDRVEEIQKIYSLIQKSDQAKKNAIFVLIGDHGMGKTSTLKKVILDAKGRNILPIMVNLRSPQRIKFPGPDLIFKIFRKVNFSEISISQKDLNKIECHQDVKNLFKAIFSGSELQDLAISYIKGEVKLSVKELKQIGVIRKIEDFDILKEYLEVFLIILKKVGYSTLFVAFDEFEYLFSLVSPKDQSIYLALFREIYDMPSSSNLIGTGKSANIVIVWGTSEDGWTRFNELSSGGAKNRSVDAASAALLRRIKNNRILLNPFNKELTGELIKKRLSIARSGQPSRNSPLIPYTQDFVDFMYKQTGGRLSDVLLYCDISLEAGLEMKIEKIDAEFAKKAIKEKGYSISYATNQNTLF